jgi:hypothetical protein
LVSRPCKAAWSTSGSGEHGLAGLVVGHLQAAEPDRPATVQHWMLGWLSEADDAV